MVRNDETPLSADLDSGGADESVFGHFEIGRRGAGANSSRRVKNRAMAGAEPSPVIALVTDRYATEMRADADNDEPFRLFYARGIWLGVAKRGERRILRSLDLVLRAMAHEDRSAAPFHRDDLPLSNAGDIDLYGRQRQRRGVGTYLRNERPDGSGHARGGGCACGDVKYVTAVWLSLCRLSHL